MEEELQQWLKLLPFCIVIMAAMLKLAEALWWRPRGIEAHFEKQGIRGPKYRFFRGNMSEVVTLMTNACSHPLPRFSHNILPRVLPFYHHWRKLYGSTFLMWFGPSPRLAVSDPDLIREIFVSKFYEKKEPHPLVKRLEGDGLLSLEGEKHVRHRKTISPAFNTDNTKLMIPMIATCAKEIIDRFHFNTEEEIELDVSDWFQTLVEDVIIRTAFGSFYDEGKEIFRLQTKQMILAGESFSKLFSLSFRWVYCYITFLWVDRKVRKLIARMVDRRRRVISGGGKAKDLLGVMVQSSFSDEEIVEELKTTFFAGKQTTSNLLTWTALLLSMHPQWQIIARDEVIRVCGSRDVPSENDVVKLKMLGLILNESLRLYSPTVATIRRAKSDVDLGPYKIPRGTEILIPILALHHDPMVWGSDVNEFNPARFANGSACAGKHPAVFIPFGLGSRVCIGQNLALLQAKIVLAIILRRFSFHLSTSYQHAPTVLMMLHPQHGAQIVFRTIPNQMNV